MLFIALYLISCRAPTMKAQKASKRRFGHDRAARFPAMAGDGRDAGCRMAGGLQAQSSPALGLLALRAQQCALDRMGLAGAQLRTHRSAGRSLRDERARHAREPRLASGPKSRERAILRTTCALFHARRGGSSTMRRVA